MSKLRKEPTHLRTSAPPSPSRESLSPIGGGPLRVLASGVIFLTHNIELASFPGQGSNTRAQNVVRTRGGAAAACLSILAQFAGTQTWLVAPIGTGPEGAALRIELEREGISTQFCTRREADGVPKAFVIKSSCVILRAPL